MEWLTRQQLKDMTGGKRPKEIVEWLQKNAPGRWREGIDGWPRVAVEVARDIFGVESAVRVRKGALNFDHLRRRNGKTTDKESRSA
jgi:hypothetical protein